MADDQLAGIGWGGEFWLSDGAATPVLTELVQVKSFTLPQEKQHRDNRQKQESPKIKKDETTKISIVSPKFLRSSAMEKLAE